MKIKTSELSGPALDWAVAKCEGIEVLRNPFGGDIPGFWTVGGMFNSAHKKVGVEYSPSTSWEQGGPIIEREKIGTWPSEKEDHEGQWGARVLNTYIMYGPTPLIAAMRCYVAIKLGDEVEVPGELASKEIE